VNVFDNGSARWSKQGCWQVCLGTGNFGTWLDALARSSSSSGHTCNSLSNVIDRSLAMGREVKGLCRKDMNMNQQTQAEEELITETHLETDASEREKLAQCGCSTEEIVAFLWLRRWYQAGGSDRMELLRHWEFLKQLVITGRLDV
jgi:hypothetical protein